MVSKSFAILFAFAAPVFFAPAQVVETVPKLAGKSVVCVVRNQYPVDHHNTANIFQKGEINQNSWEKTADGGSSLIKIDFDSSGKPKIETLLSLPEGIVRDPEVSPDAARILFSMRENFDDSYGICELDLRSAQNRRLTPARGSFGHRPRVPSGRGDRVRLHEGGEILRLQPAHNVHLYKMSPDGSNTRKSAIP